MLSDRALSVWLEILELPPSDRAGLLERLAEDVAGCVRRAVRPPEIYPLPAEPERLPRRRTTRMPRPAVIMPRPALDGTCRAVTP